MNIGDYDDVQRMISVLGADAFKEAILTAEPGWFTERSWSYWCYRLGITEPGDALPPIPQRVFLNQIAARIVNQATQPAPSELVEPVVAPEKNPAAVALGKLGGKKGGPARAKKLTPAERSEIASRAAVARWSKKKS
jgi:hypothetical protein